MSKCEEHGGQSCQICATKKYSEKKIGKLRGKTKCPHCDMEVKSCPFCGADGMIYGENLVGCSDFQCSSNVDYGHWCGEENGIPAVHHVIAGWNTRISDEENDKYMIERYERVIELINAGESHMAVAKLLADISALKGQPQLNR